MIDGNPTEKQQSHNQDERTMEYLKKHNLPILFERLGSLLIHHQPENPREFMLENLKAYRQYRQNKIGQPPLLLFSRDDLMGLFKLHDVTRKGSISRSQYLEIMTAIGAPAGSVNGNPKGSETETISLETFLEEASTALSSIDFM